MERAVEGTSPTSGAHDAERSLLLSASKGRCCQRRPRLCSWEVDEPPAVASCHIMPRAARARPPPSPDPPSRRRAASCSRAARAALTHARSTVAPPSRHALARRLRSRRPSMQRAHASPAVATAFQVGMSSGCIGPGATVLRQTTQPPSHCAHGRPGLQSGQSGK